MNSKDQKISFSPLKRMLFSICLFGFSAVSYAQSGVTLNISPTYMRLDYHQFLAEGRHGYELGIGSRLGINSESRSNFGRENFIDASYHYQFIQLEKSRLSLGLGYRTPSVHNKGYISYGGLFIPITYTRFFFEDNAALRIRLSPYFGSDPDVFIPSLGFVFLL